MPWTQSAVVLVIRGIDRNGHDFRPEDAGVLPMGCPTYDRPGYGLCSLHQARWVADAAGDVRAIADAVGLDRFGVAGVSAGAAAALGCAPLLPERVLRCATVEGAAPITAEGLDFGAGMSDESRRDWTLGLEGVEAIEKDWLTVVEWVGAGSPSRKRGAVVGRRRPFRSAR